MPQNKIIIDFFIKLLISKNLTTKKNYIKILIIINKLTNQINIIQFKKKYIIK